MRSDAPSAAKLLLSSREAAALLSVSLRTVESLIARGEVRSILIGRCRRVPRTALVEFIESRRDAAK